MKSGADILLLLRLLGLFGWLYTGAVTPAPHGYCAGDYMDAASPGWRAHTPHPRARLCDQFVLFREDGRVGGPALALCGGSLDGCGVLFARNNSGAAGGASGLLLPVSP